MENRYNRIYITGLKTHLSNFRPITMINSIYKIWATISTNRLKHITNRLTDERQHAYKSNKSTIDAIYNIKRNLVKKQRNGEILLGLSNAFDRIDRVELWNILYEKGLPANLIKLIKEGHINNMLRSKQNGKYANEINNNIGVFQGSPISENLCIMYADHVMNNYSTKIKAMPITVSKIKIRNRKIEAGRSSHIAAKLNFSQEYEIPNRGGDGKRKWIIPHPTIFSQGDSDFLLYADDTNIQYNTANGILPKLQTYKEKDEHDKFIIRWGKVLILMFNKDKINVKTEFGNSPEPYCNIKHETKAKVLGHIMDDTNNINNAITDRIQKCNKAWELIKGKPIGGTGINIKLRLMLFGSLITGIPLYSLHIIPICNGSINKLQQLHSKCARIITQ